MSGGELGDGTDVDDHDVAGGDPFRELAAADLLELITVAEVRGCDPEATIADIARVLRPGGTLVIACRVSNDDTPPWIDPDIHPIRSAAEITTMLRGAGFDHVEHERGDATAHHIHLLVARLAS